MGKGNFSDCRFNEECTESCHALLLGTAEEQLALAVEWFGHDPLTG